VILGASALLALSREKTGQNAVFEAIAVSAGACAANIAEAATVLVRGGMPGKRVRMSVIALLPLTISDVASRPVLTAHRAWADLGAAVGADIRLIR
jgi:PIN domain nuclease of toxin-antitoxin system